MNIIFFHHHFIGIRIFNHSEVGTGLLVELSKMNQTADYDCCIVTGPDSTIKVDKNTDPSYFLPQNPLTKKMKIAGEMVMIPKSVIDRGPKNQEENDLTPVTFPCSRQFCIAEFPTYEQLREHLAAEKCYEACLNQPISEYLRVRYFMYWGSMSAKKSEYFFSFETDRVKLYNHIFFPKVLLNL